MCRQPEPRRTQLLAFRLYKIRATTLVSHCGGGVTRGEGRDESPYTDQEYAESDPDEVRQGLSESASWHAKFKDSAYIFAGGLSFDLTEGDILAVFSQYGEIVDVNLVRAEDTGKPKGFAFICYEDQRSTVLAVDNLNGAKVLGRTIRVEHVEDYRLKDPDAAKKKEWRSARVGRRTSNRGITVINAADPARRQRTR